MAQTDTVVEIIAMVARFTLQTKITASSSTTDTCRVTSWQTNRRQQRTTLACSVSHGPNSKEVHPRTRHVLLYKHY